MKRRKDWKSNFPDTDQIVALLPTLAIVLLLSSYLLYAALSIVPEVRAMNGRIEELAAKKEELLELRQAREDRSPSLERQLDLTRNTLDEKYQVFLSKGVAAQSLDELYRHADEAHVTIVDLKNQPSPKKKALYDVESFRLQVEGSMSDLLHFVSRVHETIDFKSFVISDVSVVPRDDTHLLTMDIALYTSPYASEDISASPIMEGALRAQQSLQGHNRMPQPEGDETPAPSLIERESYQSPRPHSWPTHWPWPPPGEGDVPGTVPYSELPATEHLHVVQTGETLLSIALKHNSSVEAIVTANHLKDGRFHVGQQLRVPVYESASLSP